MYWNSLSTLHSKPHSTHAHEPSCLSICSSVGVSASIHVLLTSCWLVVQGKHSISWSRPSPDPSTSTGAWNLGGEGREEDRERGEEGGGRKEEEKRRERGREEEGRQEEGREEEEGRRESRREEERGEGGSVRRGEGRRRECKRRRGEKDGTTGKFSLMQIFV